MCVQKQLQPVIHRLPSWLVRPRFGLQDGKISVLIAMTPNDPYRGRTALLTSKRCILYIYSTNIGTEYLKYGIHSPFFSSSKCSLFHNSNVFGSCIIHILYIYSTNIVTEYLKYGIHSPFFSSSKCSLFHNSNVFGSCNSHNLYTECAKIKKIFPSPKG